METRTEKRHVASDKSREAYGAGAVVDNRDPERKGRVRVSLDRTAPGSESGWLPVLRRRAGAGHGLWTLTEIGTQAVYALTDAERGAGLVLGFIYDGKRRPPEGSAGKAAESTLVHTRKHRIEITDEDGREEIRIESADGKMRAVLGRDGGIRLANGLGDINIKCRSIRAEGDGLSIQAGGKAALSTEDTLRAKADGTIAIESEKEVKVSGKNVRMSGSRGVCAEGKQVAVEGDKVTGFDVHIMVVPSGTGTANVPLPHPFMGELKDKLAKDVKVGSRKCATKGSVARHSDAAHMQLPGTIKFQQGPKKEGEVTGGTSAKVRIGGKEAAVIGSTVTTCNDVGARDNSTVVAAGAGMPMPKIINPLNTEEWKREREDEDKKEPSFQSAKWARTTAEEGEEVGLTASVKDIADGNTVTLQVFPEGKGPEDGAAYARLPATVRDGTASAKWSYRADRRGVTFTVYNKQTGEEVFHTGAEVRDGIAEAEWTYHYGGEKLDAKPKFCFEAAAARCRKARSKDMELSQKFEITVLDEYTYIQKDIKAKLSNGEETIEKETSNGKFEFEVVPGDWNFIITEIMDTWEYGVYENIDENKNIIYASYNKIVNEGIKCYVSSFIILVEFLKGISR